MAATHYRFEARALLCSNCGAPLAAEVSGGQVACQYCSAVNVFAARVALPTFALPAAVALSEPERLARLRAQLERERPTPAAIASLFDQERIPEWRVTEAFGVFRSLRERATGGDYSAADDLAFLAMALGRVLDREPARQRALLESALEALSVPRHRQVILAALARGAAREGDLTGAERWLERCDPSLDDLGADSAYRVARALCATLRNSSDDVLQVLGAKAGVIPVAPEWGPLVALARANALVALGRSGEASQALTTAELPTLEPEYFRYRAVLAPDLLKRAARSHIKQNGCLTVVFFALAVLGWGVFALTAGDQEESVVLGVVGALGIGVGILGSLGSVVMTVVLLRSLTSPRH